MDAHHETGAGGGRGHFDPRNPHDPMQTKILNCQNLEELTNVILLDQFEFNLVHCSTAFNKFGVFRKEKQKLNAREQGALKALLDMANGKQFLPRQASNIIRAIAVGGLGEENPQALTLLETLVEQENYQQWKPMELAHIIDALTTLNMRHESFFAKMAKELPERNLSSFNAQDIVVFLTGYAHLRVPAPEVFDAFAKEMQNRDLKQDMKDKARRGDMDSTLFTLQRLVAILCAYAQLGHRMDLSLLEKIAHEIATRSMKFMRPSELANVAWAFTVLGYQPKGVFEKIIAEVEAKRMKFTYHQLATVAWAFATFSMSQDQMKKLFDVLAKELKIRNEKDASVESLVNICWAFSKVGFTSQMLFVKIANEIAQNRDLNDFTSDQIAHLAWAFAASNFRHSSLYESIARNVASRQLDEFTPFDLATIAWSLGTSHAENTKPGLDRVGQEIFTIRGLGGCTTPQLAELLRGFGEARANGLEVESLTFQRVSDEVNSRGLQSFRPKDIGNLLAAYGKLGWNDSDLFEKASDLLVTQALDNFTIADLSNIAWAFAALGFHHRALFDRICNACVMKGGFVRTISVARDVIVLVWSLACNQALYSTHAKSLFSLTIPSFSGVVGTARNLENALMLTACVAAWRQAHDGQDLPALLTQLVGTDGWMEQVLAQQKHDNPIVTEVQQQISKALQEMGYVHLVDNFRTADNIAAAVRVSSNVVLDVIDPWGGLLCDGKTLSGMATFKRRLLQNNGFWVAQVNPSEWKALGDSADEEKEISAKEAYLRDLLNKLS